MTPARCVIVAASLLALPECSLGLEVILQDFGNLRNGGRAFSADSMLEVVGHAMSPQDSGANTTYTNAEENIVVEVTLFQHANGAWTEHEVEGMYSKLDRAHPNVSIVGGPGTRRFELVVPSSFNPTGVVGWVSGGDTVVDIECTYMGTNRVAVLPQDIVDAYLALYPSSLPMSLVDTSEHHTAWARDEMRRILEYARRDYGGGRTARVEEWVKRFANFREVYYATSSSIQFEYELERLKLEIATEPVKGRPDTRLERALGDHLREFETWWVAHQNDPVLPFTPGATPRPRATLVRPKLPKAYQDVYDFVYRQQTAAATRATAVPTPPPPTP